MAGNYHNISEEQKQLVLAMSLRGMTAKAIKDTTGPYQKWLFTTKHRRSGKIYQPVYVFAFSCHYIKDM